eukprot:TRINITY_DN6468_c0_g1_i3.p1 TRINITY_DN6468_c0_g1~~TRINITY_DN6468_c0_g1_i3.p1  ORF type:complete len:105 (+),score=4.50 TRINITY_DN6468_c0_g1_i3:415-729(+)
MIFDAHRGTLDYPATGDYSNSEVACFFFSCPEKGVTLRWKSFNTERYYDHVFAFPVSGSAAGSIAVLPLHSGDSLHGLRVGLGVREINRKLSVESDIVPAIRYY